MHHRRYFKQCYLKGKRAAFLFYGKTANMKNGSNEFSREAWDARMGDEGHDFFNICMAFTACVITR